MKAVADSKVDIFFAADVDSNLTGELKVSILAVKNVGEGVQ